MPNTTSTPAAVLEHFVRFVHAARLEDAVCLYEPEATMVEKPGRLARGEAEIRAALASLIASAVRLRIDVTQVVFASDIAFVASSWSVAPMEGGTAVVVASGEGTDVMRRQADGNWKFVIDNPYGAALATAAP